MRARQLIFAMLCSCIIAIPVWAIEPSAPQQWDRAAAMATVQSVDIDEAVNKIGNISTLGDANATLDKLTFVETRTDWPLPAREAVLYRFTRSLAALPRDAVAVEVMQHLFTYQAKALVPHEDHGNAFEPLFNIRAAAQGVENRWLRAESATAARVLLARNPGEFVNSYKGVTNYNNQSGYLDALRDATLYEALIVQSMVIQQLGDSPELTNVLAITAGITENTYAVQQLLLSGSGAALAQSLRALGEQMPAATLADLLNMAINTAPPSNAALAIAEWWPQLQQDAQIRDLLLGTLNSPELGSAAALALANSPDLQTIRVLQQTASGDSVAARRAQSALDINRANLIGEVQK